MAIYLTAICKALATTAAQSKLVDDSPHIMAFTRILREATTMCRSKSAKAVISFVTTALIAIAAVVSLPADLNAQPAPDAAAVPPEAPVTNGEAAPLNVDSDAGAVLPTAADNKG